MLHISLHSPPVVSTGQSGQGQVHSVVCSSAGAVALPEELHLVLWVSDDKQPLVVSFLLAFVDMGVVTQPLSCKCKP